MPHDPINDKVCQPLYPMCMSRLSVCPTNSFVAIVHITYPAGQRRPTLQTFWQWVCILWMTAAYCWQPTNQQSRPSIFICGPWIQVDFWFKNLHAESMDRMSPQSFCDHSPFWALQNGNNFHGFDFHVDVEWLKGHGTVPWHIRCIIPEMMMPF